MGTKSFKLLIIFVFASTSFCFCQMQAEDFKKWHHLEELPFAEGVKICRFYYVSGIRMLQISAEYRTSDTGRVLVSKASEIFDHKIVEIHVSKRKNWAYVYVVSNQAKRMSATPKSGWRAFKKAFLGLNFQNLSDSAQKPFKHIVFSQLDCLQTGFEFWDGKSTIKNMNFPQDICCSIRAKTGQLSGDGVKKETDLLNQFSQIATLFFNEFDLGY
jgi:hypothetical protein